MAEETKKTEEQISKTQITIKLDSDVLNYFKERAAEPNAAPYQTQINNELRAVMENDGDAGKEKGKGKKEKADFSDLIGNKKFIKAIAKEVRKSLGKQEDN